MPNPPAARQRTNVDKTHGRRKAVRFARRLAREIVSDRVTDVGAMMAYYAVLALFPMVVFVLSVAMLVIDDATVLEGVGMVTSAMPAPTRELVATYVKGFMDTAGAGFAVGGALLALWGASRGAVALSGALNTTFSTPETRPWWKRQLTAVVVTLTVATVTLIALSLLLIGPIAGHWIADHFGLGGLFDNVWSVGRWVGAGVLVMVVWAVAYKFLPDTDAPFRVFTPGAAIGVLLWLLASYAFGLYLGHFGSYEATYGALGTAIIFLTWLWISNIALLIGAEINGVIAAFRAEADPARGNPLQEPDSEVVASKSSHGVPAVSRSS